MAAGQTAKCDGALVPIDNLRRAKLCATLTVPNLQADIALCETESRAAITGLKKRIAERDAILQEAAPSTWHTTISLLVVGALIGVSTISAIRQGD